MVAKLKIGKPDKGRYTITFETDHGTITCEVAPLPNRPKGSSGPDEREAALKRAKRMARAFSEAIPDA